MNGVSGAVTAPVILSPATLSPAAPTPSPIATTPSLPDAEPLSPASMGDAMSALYAVLAESREQDLKSGTERVEGIQQLREKALADARAAIDRQSQDEKSSGFWHDFENVAMVVAKVALAVAAVAVTVVTAGAASPVLIGVALLFMAGGMVVSQTNCLGDASQWVGAGMQLVGAVLTCGAGMATASETVGSQVLTTTSTAANATGVTAETAAGAAHIEGGVIAADSQNASADLQQSHNQLQHWGQLVSWVISSLGEDDKAQQRGQTTLRGAIATNEKTFAISAASVAVKG